MPITVDKTSFDLSSLFPGIEASQISNVQQAEITGTTISNYTLGKAISYDYNCGNVDGEPFFQMCIRDRSSILLCIILALTFSAISVVFAYPMIDFFKLNDPQVAADARISVSYTHLDVYKRQCLLRSS